MANGDGDGVGVFCEKAGKKLATDAATSAAAAALATTIRRDFR